MSDLAIGIDIGGTNTDFGIFNSTGECLNKWSIPTADYKKTEDFVFKLHEIIESEFKLDKEIICGIGVGAPSANSKSGCIEHAPNLPWKGIIKIKSLFETVFNIPVFIENDANVAALGEKHFGGAKQMQDYIVITLGTGLGSGIIVNGSLLKGAHGIGGEIGHINVVRNGRQCGCGKRGCLETYASATGLLKTATELLENLNENSSLRSIPISEITSKDIGEAASSGDKIATEALNYTGKILGETLGDIISIFNPEAIFIGGGMASAGSILFESIITNANRNLMLNLEKKVKICPSMLNSECGLALSASVLVWNNKNDIYQQ